uniref:Uncharacterized protein n=1 Tax=Trichobilharzia regenti TaxID=157069 RepID=A0AA85J7X4_TRIRE|nr:unnamed protein product [Trichobilharzia regenti]
MYEIIIMIKISISIVACEYLKRYLGGSKFNACTQFITTTTTNNNKNQFLIIKTSVEKILINIAVTGITTGDKGQVTDRLLRKSKDIYIFLCTLLFVIISRETSSSDWLFSH